MCSRVHPSLGKHYHAGISEKLPNMGLYSVDESTLHIGDSNISSLSYDFFSFIFLFFGVLQK